MKLKIRFARQMLSWLFLLICSLFLLGGIANAGLIDLDNGVIHDDATGLYWIQDLSLFRNLNYADQLDKISTTTITDTQNMIIWTDFTMATLDQMTNLWKYTYNEITQAFLPTSNNWWNGRFDALRSGYSDWHHSAKLRYDTYDNVQIKENPLTYTSWGDGMTSGVLGAWAVTGTRSNLPAPVPVPATIMLFSFGLLGIAGVTRKRNE